MIQTETNPDKHARNRLLHFADCAHAIDQLFLSALTRQGPDAFSEFLNFAGRFNNLSIYNTMLVRLQRPGAAMVGSRKQWREIGRQVLPDAIPIVILWPFGPVQFLFELGDTDGAPLPAQNQNPLFARGEITEELFRRTINAAKNFAVEVANTDHYGIHLAGTATGFGICPERITDNNEKAFRIKINAKHDLPSRYATLAHELGHIYCGHLGADAKGRWPNRRSLFLSDKAMEIEAEAVAWLVCQRNGITTRSKEYMNSLIERESLNAVSMYAIYEAANRVESRSLSQKK